MDVPTQDQSPTPAAVAMVLGSILSIQIGSAIAVDLFSDIGATGVVFMRALVSAVLLVAIWRPDFRVPRSDRKVTLLFGIALAGVNLCFYESIDRIPLGTAVTFEFLGPLTVALITSPRRRDWLWAGLAAAGILLLTGGVGGDDLDPVGIAFALVAAFFWGAYIMLGTRLGQQAAGGKGLAVAMTIAAVLTAPTGIIDGGMELLDPTVILIGISVGILSSAIPFSLELEAMRRLPSNVFGVMMSIEPGVAAIVGFLLLDQGVVPIEIVAIGLVVVASAGAIRSSTNAPPPIEP
ncbi:MAG: DMT family transporter [Thermoleophilia bacterium]|nr:DMT family transporter [Thermoleophilia bacterium]